ncbi:unnamed protein product [Fraxinus pennsylvanica]|uniref:Cysteine-rich receptor-like protein kinase 10 n=1 Tax=Fraxinus pennsylvanica TaxID=56036 RepID=A0AAD2DQK3_9LAMI|nr:unnamed protein product [Fraxinus pennsylvanica]
MICDGGDVLTDTTTPTVTRDAPITVASLGADGRENANSWLSPGWRGRERRRSPDSTYRSNLNQLFLTLSSNATRDNGFYSYTVGRGPPDRVNGLFLCRGDVNIDVCEECVRNATTEILRRCPKEKDSTIWYDECMLRYSNISIFSRADQNGGIILSNNQNITDQPDRFRTVLAATLNESATEAANDLSGKKFATKQANFTAFQTLYTLAQCTPDLSSGQCNTCLRDCISNFPSCCDIKQGARVNFLSCNIRYEMYPFYNFTLAPAPPNRNTPPLPPLPPSRSTRNEGNGGMSRQVIIAIVVPIVVSLLIFFIGCFFLTRRAKQKRYDAVNEENDEGNDISTVESLQYDLNAVGLATNNFSPDNKIGEGGFGSVYKGTLSNGQEIAVKRLSKNSGQEGEEKILIYEFVPNKSLDYFLFDPEKGQLLDWSKRNTSRIVGTYGYMSPEYAMHGQFSVKSDVFSFGVLILEIISGKKNSSFYQSDGAEDLLSYAWKLWRDNTPLELIDPTLQNSYARNEAIRCIQIGLLCVQEDVDERPNMASILLTLNSSSATLAVPGQPAFFLHSKTRNVPKLHNSDKSTSTSTALSINEASITELYPR